MELYFCRIDVKNIHANRYLRLMELYFCRIDVKSSFSVHHFQRSPSLRSDMQILPMEVRIRPASGSYTQHITWRQLYIWSVLAIGIRKQLPAGVASPESFLCIIFCRWPCGKELAMLINGG
jgi:hypothetical protein